ncbi:HGxxPAAW family protein [Spongiactinospora sp. TRM90649]|uniref:HGxxPAAW family protein n=1 Tax=Spongiactinospora sp. TRM90649 TaxID=3031114 RepID=UPI0023F7AB45|nr:HGxxPAAW family protein [Spongiactinospora sp. TRM90649]MDF5755985.1 hypothetical protein [Spongiactinospora sp. TRM90649]
MAGKDPSNDHGSPAAWTAVAIMLVGTTLSGLALIWDSPATFFAGLGVVVLGGVVGKVMQMMGMGKQTA